MYDLEVAVPLSNFNHYRQRLLDFKQIGLLNVKDRKVIVKALTGTELIADIENGWTDVKVEAISSTRDHVTCRTYHYYANLKESQARWYIRVDDDSATDVDGLITSLDRHYDYEREYYLGTEIRREHYQNTPEYRLLQEMGYEHVLGNNKTPMAHEWECSVLSCGAVRRMLTTQDTIDFAAKRSEIPDNYSDWGLACMAAIAKIYMIECPFLSKDNHVRNFSLVEGDLNHIHFISRDQTPNLVAILKNLNKEPSSLAKTLIDQEYRLDIQDGTSFNLQFKRNGRIVGSPSENAAYWLTNNEVIEMLNEGGIVTSFFYPKGDHFSGHSLLDLNQKYTLRPKN